MTDTSKKLRERVQDAVEAWASATHLSGPVLEQTDLDEAIDALITYTAAKARVEVRQVLIDTLARHRLSLEADIAAMEYIMAKAEADLKAIESEVVG